MIKNSFAEAQSKLTIPYGHPKTRRALVCNHLITNGPHYAVKSIYLLSQRREGKNSAPVENQVKHVLFKCLYKIHAIFRPLLETIEFFIPTREENDLLDASWNVFPEKK